MNDAKVIPITFPAKLLKTLRLASANEGVSIAYIVRVATRMYLRKFHKDLYWERHRTDNHH